MFAPALAASPMVSGPRPPSTYMQMFGPFQKAEKKIHADFDIQLGEFSAQLPDFGHHVGHEGLAAKAGLHRHHQHHVHLLCQGQHCAHRCAGLDGTA